MCFVPQFHTFLFIINLRINFFNVENVQIFNTGGDLLMHFGGAYKGAGAMWLPAAVEISYENLTFFEPYVDDSFVLKYLIYVTNQYGPAKLNVYGFVEEKPILP